jgi:hypothetical protein
MLKVGLPGENPMQPQERTMTSLNACCRRDARHAARPLAKLAPRGAHSKLQDSSKSPPRERAGHIARPPLALRIGLRWANARSMRALAERAWLRRGSSMPTLRSCTRAGRVSLWRLVRGSVALNRKGDRYRSAQYQRHFGLAREVGGGETSPRLWNCRRPIGAAASVSFVSSRRNAHTYP